ncbi:MAG: XTP/dITP diphosphatase [Clostridiales bacterium]|jgi:XTP/dITP diphosphohydrolase|nr:XTP/dITP diphosphatase [Clostridiales bacterium]
MIVVAATQNKHKIAEIDAIMKPFGYKVISRAEAGVPDIEIEEDGDTFEENSLKKAMEIHKLCGEITIADDSGLMVDILDGAPGVHSSRFAGEEGNDEKNNQKLLKLLSNIPIEQRTAKFVSVITMVFSVDRVVVARGECKGHILFEPRGENGFGYDPLFVPDGYDKSFGELSSEEKNKISHRAMALQALEKQLRSLNL